MKRKPKLRPTLKDKLDAHVGAELAVARAVRLRRAREKFILGLPLSDDERWTMGVGSDRFRFARAILGFWWPRPEPRQRVVSVLVAALDQPA